MPASPGSRVPATIRQLGRVHHVAVVVADLDARARLLAGHPRPARRARAADRDRRVTIAFLPVGESKVELVMPTDDTTGVARFLASKGEGFHHVCFEVDNLAETLMRLELDGLELIDTRAPEGCRGTGRVPPPAVMPWRARRADRGARRAGWASLGYAPA